MATFLETISPEPMRRMVATLIRNDAAVRVQSYLLGPDRMLQWAHTIGLAAHEALRPLVSPVPPLEVRRVDAPPDEPLYLWNSLADIMNYFSIYQRLGNEPTDRKPHVLDFGCGSGRLTRFLNMYEEVEPFAVDANPLLVEWCQLNLDRVVTLLQAGRQSLPFGNAMFDFIYANSLFTGVAHNRMQQRFDEITRVMAPGGLLLAVTFGQTALNTIRGSAAHQATFQIDAARTAELIEALPVEGCIHLPRTPQGARPEQAEAGDGYTFIDPEYPAANWNPEAFEVLQHIPGGLRGWQDIVVLRRREPEEGNG